MMLSVQYCAVYMLGHILVHLAVAYVAVYTLCSEKKHPLTFSFIPPWVMCRFKQKLQ